MDNYALVAEFKGRNSPVTKQPVKMSMWRLFDREHLIDKCLIILESAYLREELHDLTPSQARDKWDKLVRWWE